VEPRHYLATEALPLVPRRRRLPLEPFQELARAVIGFYLIQTFEKWTVPVAAAFMILISILAWTKADVVWSHSTVHGGDKWTAITQLMTAIGVGWGSRG
jgi:hypothetical protein